MVLVRWIFAIFFLAAFAACKQKTAIPATASTELAPVPPPAGLIGEVLVSHPDRTWELVRTSLATNSSLLPGSLAVFLAGPLSLPLPVLEQLDLNLPVVGAIVLRDEQIEVLAGVHVKDGARVVDLMTGAPHFTKTETDAGVSLLAPPPGRAREWSYGVSGNYLLIGQSDEALQRAGTFVARTLPGRPRPTEDLTVTVSRSAIAGPITGRLQKIWAGWKGDRELEDTSLRTKHGGGSPDFGDPAQALADVDAKAAKLFAVLGDLEEARLALTVEPEVGDLGMSYRVLVSMKPLPGTGPAGQEIATMPVSTVDPLLALPSSVAVALLTHDTAKLREQSSSAQIDAISNVLGGRLQETDKGKIATAFQSWSKGRGNWLTAGLVWNGPTRAAVVRGAVADASELGRGATSMLKLLGIRAIADPISNWLGDMKLSTVPAAATTDAVQTVHVTRKPPKSKLRSDKPAPQEAFDIVWSVGPEVFVGAAGIDAKAAHASLQKTETKNTLEQDPLVKGAAKRLGATVSFALLVDVSRFGEVPGQRSGGTPLLLAYGKDGRGQAWFELDVPAAAIPTYGAFLGAFR